MSKRIDKLGAGDLAAVANLAAVARAMTEPEVVEVIDLVAQAQIGVLLASLSLPTTLLTMTIENMRKAPRD